MAAASVTMLIRGVPADLKAAVISDAEKREIGMNDVIVGILAARYSIKFETSDRKMTSTPGLSADLVLRMPDTLRRAIAVDAAKRGGSQRAVVVAAVARHYGMPEPSLTRRRRQGRRSRDTATA